MVMNGNGRMVVNIVGWRKKGVRKLGFVEFGEGGREGGREGRDF